MKYLAKLWLNATQYLAVMETCMAIVTVDENKNPVRWHIFGGEYDKIGK